MLRKKSWMKNNICFYSYTISKKPYKTYLMCTCAYRTQIYTFFFVVVFEIKTFRCSKMPLMVIIYKLEPVIKWVCKIRNKKTVFLFFLILKVKWSFHLQLKIDMIGYLTGFNIDYIYGRSETKVKKNYICHCWTATSRLLKIKKIYWHIRERQTRSHQTSPKYDKFRHKFTPPVKKILPTYFFQVEEKSKFSKHQDSQVYSGVNFE